MKRQPGTLSNILKNGKFTDFEKDVYEAVLSIPMGKVRSYGWVARRVRRPAAARAVGNALNKNAYPGAIPCHRVVRSDGSIGGYSGGVILKRKMLQAEGVDCSGGRCYNR